MKQKIDHILPKMRIQWFFDPLSENENYTWSEW
jgi:hypothetical protein